MIRINAHGSRLLFLGIPLLIVLGSVPALGKIHLPFRRSGQRSAGPSLRRRLNINSIITEPGTFETEWSNIYSTSGTFFMPTTLKLTPGTGTGFWGRTELSASFDSMYSASLNNQRSTQFSDHVTVASTSVIYAGQQWNVAIAPVATFYWRDEKGARLGAVAIARYDSGLNTAGVSVSWTGATSPSPTNPAGTLDLVGGYGRKLANAGAMSHLTPYGNVVYERSSGGFHGLSLVEGLEYQVNGKIAVEMATQQLNLYGSSLDYQFILGLTVNFGPPKKWFGNHYR
jgi:hypothetical protein